MIDIVSTEDKKVLMTNHYIADYDTETCEVKIRIGDELRVRINIGEIDHIKEILDKVKTKHG